MSVPANIYFGDISANISNFLFLASHLVQVLSCLAINNFFIKLSKCVFGQDTVDYLGHIVSSGGVSADPQKIEAMAQWP